MRHAGGADAEGVLVEIGLEDGVLCEGLLDAEGQDGLLDLALYGDFVGQQEVLGYLLGDGGGTDRPAVGADVGDVGDNGAKHRNGVDARGVADVTVPGREDGVDWQSDVKGKRVSLRVDRGGRCIR